MPLNLTVAERAWLTCVVDAEAATAVPSERPTPKTPASTRRAADVVCIFFIEISLKNFVTEVILDECPTETSKKRGRTGYSQSRRERR